jgi:multiple sugar transport system permease protein
MPAATARRRRFDFYPYLLLAPALLVLGLTFVYPLLDSAWISLHSYNLNRPRQGFRYIGLDNYSDLFTDPDFYHSLWLTIYWTAGSVAGQALLGLAAALLLNRSFPGRAIARAVVLLPWAVPTVLVAIVFGTIFNAQGIFDDVLLRLGLIDNAIPFLSSDLWAMPTLIFAHIWKGFPFVAVMLLAGLQAIPRDLYEAAAIDGASEWQRFLWITMPQLRGVALITLLLATIFALKSIDYPYIMTYGGPGGSTTVVAFLAYATAFGEFALGRGSAIATVLTFLTVCISYFYLRVRGTE